VRDTCVNLVSRTASRINRIGCNPHSINKIRDLSTQIVNRWGKLLQERSDTLAEADKDGAQRYPSVAIMQSTLFEKIARPVGDAFRSQVRTTPALTTGIFRWSQRARWPVHPSQGVDRILIPVFNAQHWVLVEADMRASCMRYYDSLMSSDAPDIEDAAGRRRPHERYTGVIQQWLDAEAVQRGLTPVTWRQARHEYMPRQTAAGNDFT
jgi:hypothetical protein